MDKGPIFGFGTGRCGTNSLAVLLGKQPGVVCGHEIQALPWEPDHHLMYRMLLNLYRVANSSNGAMPCNPMDYIRLNEAIESKNYSHIEIIGGIRSLFEQTGYRPANVCFSLLNYIQYLINIFPDLKAVCLKRDKEPTVKSWMQHVTTKANYWTRRDSSHFKREYVYVSKMPYFPQYDLPKEDALRAYWDEYYAKAGDLETLYPENVWIFDSPEVFNELDYQNEMLDWLEIDEKDRVLARIHLAQSEASSVP